MTSKGASSGGKGASERDAVYERLMSRTDLAGLDDAQALDHVGKLTDLSLDLRRRAGLERAVALSAELQERELSKAVRATSHYFLGNAWASLRSLSDRDRRDWEQPELEREVFHHRMALRDEATSYALPKQRAAQMLTNLGNTMSEVGRPVEAVEYWNHALLRFPGFPMAIGNKGYGLYLYASHVHDDGHRALMMKLAHADLREALSPERRHYLQGNAAEVFAWARAKIESYLADEYLSTARDLDDPPIGGSEEEIAYRRWCLDKCLFLNSLNDLGPYAVAAADVMLLPGFVTEFGVGPTGPAIQGLYNQMKQEYVSARYLYYEGVTSPRSVHFSDKDVKLYDTLDYPAYSLAVEKTKAAFRMAYSITDRIAFFLKHYLRLSVAEDKATFRNVWYRGGVRKRGLEPGVECASNWPLRGLFWLGKDLYEDDPGFKDALEPDARDLRAYRNALEHRYLKLSEELWRGSRDRADEARHEVLKELDDDLALLRNRSDFERKALRMLKLARAALVYLCLAVYAEEGRRERDRGSDTFVPSMEAPILDDWRKA
jgi:hypothetical protein